MMRWNLHKAAALAVVLGTLLPACGFFSVQNDVSAKRVGVDLTFGAPSLSPQPIFSGPSVFPTFVVPTLPPAPTRTFTPPPPEELCPPTTDISADPEVVQWIRYDPERETPDHVLPQMVDDREATFLNAYDGSFGEQKAKAGVNDLLLANWEEEDPIQAESTDQQENPVGYWFTFEDEFNGVRIALFVSPGTPDEPSDPAQQGEGGIYLKWIDIPTADPQTEGSSRYSFRMARPYAKMIDFGVSDGTLLERSSSAVVSGGPGNDTIEDPTGQVGPLPLLNAATVTTRTRIGPAVAVPVCADLGHAYKIAWEIEIGGSFEQRMAGTFWFATQFGGWPIKSDYIMWGDGQLIQGAFSNNIMRLKPEEV